MAVDRERTLGHEAMTTGGGSGGPTPTGTAGGNGQANPVSRATVFWYSALGIALLGWFFYGWLVLKQGFIDSVGEALGTGFALLLAVSVVGAVRRSRTEDPVRRRG